MRILLLFILCLLILPMALSAQEVTVSGFPVGVARSIDKDFFHPYYNDLKAIADTLKKFPTAKAIITGGADGSTFQKDDNAKNPGLALGRAHVLYNYLMTEFNVDPGQIVISSKEVVIKGPMGRFAKIRVVKDSGVLDDLQKQMASLQDLSDRVDALEKRPPVEEHYTEVKEVPNTFSDYLGIQISAGGMTSPFGGLPTIGAAVTYKRNIYLEFNVGYTLWNNRFTLGNLKLDTKRRLIGGQIIYYPKEDFALGVLAGWTRFEEISNQYYEYVKLSEGPVLGLRYSPVDYLAVTAAYNPSKHRIIPDKTSQTKNGQFLFSISVYNIFGGK